MELSKRAILARFNGDQSAACAYCLQIAREYPRLRSEYLELAKGLAERTACAGAS